MQTNKTPLVTVAIVAWKRFEPLKNAIKSVLNQTFQDFEILVIAEADKELFKQVKKICDDFSDPHIRVEQREKRGISHGRNYGIKNAKGKYLAYLDEDDEFLPIKLEKHINILEKSKDDVILTYAQHYAWDRQNNYRVITPLIKDARDGDIFDYALRRFFQKSILFQIWDAVFKMKYVKDMELDTSLDTAEDDFLLRLLKRGKCEFIPEVLHIQYLDSEDSPSNAIVDFTKISKDYRKDIIDNKQAEIIYEKHLDYIKKHEIIYNRINSKAKNFITRGTRIIRMGNMREGRKHILFAIKLKPSFYAIFIYLLSFLGKNFFIKALRIRQRFIGGLG